MQHSVDPNVWKLAVQLDERETDDCSVELQRLTTYH